MEEKSSIFESVKNSVVGTIRGTGDVAKAVVDYGERNSGAYD